MSNNKQQTPVDIAFEKLANSGLLVTRDYKNLLAYREAKEMEKKEKEISYADGYSRGYERGLSVIKWHIEDQLKKVSER